MTDFFTWRPLEGACPLRAQHRHIQDRTGEVLAVVLRQGHDSGWMG